MPATSTANLIARAKAISDMRDNFVTPTQWLDWATQERMALDVFLAQSGWTQSFSSTVIDTTTGAASGLYPLNGPEGFGILAVVGIWEVSANQYTRPLKYENVIDFQRQLGGSLGQSRGHSRYFRLKTLQTDDIVYIDFFPEPASGETYIAVYIDHPLRLTLDSIPATGFSNSVSYPLGWEQRIILGMARLALIKEESSTSEVDKEIELWDNRIEEACWSRVLGATPTVRNVDSSERGWTRDMAYPPYSQWWWA